MGVVIAVVGASFGRDFVPIYRQHPEVDRVVLVDSDRDRAELVATEFGLTDSREYLRAVLDDASIDAVHLVTPVATHAEFAIAALDAGKHVACAVPMATTLDDVGRIIDAQDRSGKRYMMMETAVYGHHFRAVDELVRAGEFGALTLYRGFHVQNLDGFPNYWQGFPPMHYATHALSPALALTDSTVESVLCHGAGRLAPQRRVGGFDNPFPAEVGVFRLRGSDVFANVTMAFSQTASPFAEGFCLYGEHRGFEWTGDDRDPGKIHVMEPPLDGTRGNRVTTHELGSAHTAIELPASLRPFTAVADVQLEGMPTAVRMHPSHGGSHPYLVHEFVSSIVDERAPRIDARTAAAWTAPGIVAHQSALAGGVELPVPDFAH